MGEWIESFDARLEVTPPLTEKELGQIPPRRGVLGLLSENNEPIILLTAANIRARLKTRLSAPLPDRRRKTVDLREITRKASTFARALINASVIPSAMYSCSGSPDKFSNGSTAIERMGAGSAAR